MTVAAAPPNRSICQQEFKDYVWSNYDKPPPFVFVLRTSGPPGIKGHVEKVPFWDYVGVVVRTEYSGTGDRGPIWQRIGALTVKQYAWFYVNQWRGAKQKFVTTNPDGSTTTTFECYHVKDTTRDQLYKPIKWAKALGPQSSPEAWIPQNQPTVNNLVGMRETWHISLRKWKAKKNKSFMFLSGYRSGKARPCGADRKGFRIFQASLRDCTTANKNLTFEETVRRYFEPTYVVDTRGHDILDDNDYRGDLGLLVEDGGGTLARVFAGTADAFGAMSTKSFSIGFDAIKGQGVGNVHTPRFEGTPPTEANPTATLADLMMVTANKLWLARATGNGTPYANPTDTDHGVSGVTGLAVDDFNGDLLADAGLLTNGGLHVMRSQGDGSFGQAAAWWSGDLSEATRSFVGVGDFNGDGKADLVVRNVSNGAYQTALSRATCTDFSSRGPCPAGATGQPGLRDLVAAGETSWAAGDVKHVVGDYDRDGRDDVLALVRDGANFKVFGLRSLGDGTFSNPQPLGTFNLGAGLGFTDVTPVAMDVNPDGMADIALVGTTKIAWLRTNERTKTPASMTAMAARNVTGGASFQGKKFRPY